MSRQTQGELPLLTVRSRDGWAPPAASELLLSADETVSWISLARFDFVVQDDANKGPVVESHFPDNSGVSVDNDTELRPYAAIRSNDHRTVVIMAPEGCADQNKGTSIGAARTRLSHATSTVADDRQADAETRLESFLPLLPMQLNGMLADLKAVPKNLIINPHWVPMVAHELTRVALAKKQWGQTQNDYEKEKHPAGSAATTKVPRQVVLTGTHTPRRLMTQIHSGVHCHRSPRIPIPMVSWSTRSH